MLWQKTRQQEKKIELATNNLVESNNELEQKVKTKKKFSKGVHDGIYRVDLTGAYESNKLKYESMDSIGLSGIQRYDFEKEREKHLTGQIFQSAIKFISTRDITPKLSNQDSLYFGYTKFLLQDTRYELKINGENHDFRFEDRISKPIDAPIEIEMTQISISSDGMRIDTSTAVRTIN